MRPARGHCDCVVPRGIRPKLPRIRNLAFQKGLGNLYKRLFYTVVQAAGAAIWPVSEA